jgi:hypothetical protein
MRRADGRMNKREQGWKAGPSSVKKGGGEGEVILLLV